MSKAGIKLRSHRHEYDRTNTSPGFGLQLVEASLVRAQRLQSLLQAHNSKRVGHIK